MHHIIYALKRVLSRRYTFRSVDVDKVVLPPPRAATRRCAPPRTTARRRKPLRRLP